MRFSISELVPRKKGFLHVAKADTQGGRQPVVHNMETYEVHKGSENDLHHTGVTVDDRCPHRAGPLSEERIYTRRDSITSSAGTMPEYGYRSQLLARYQRARRAGVEGKLRVLYGTKYLRRTRGSEI